MNKENRQEVILQRIKYMHKMVCDPQYQNKYEIARLAKENKYIRVCGKTYRAVSLYEKSPLAGFARNGASTLTTIFNHFDNKMPPELDKKLLIKKEERRVQAWIIKQALIHNRDLLSVIKFEHCQYDKLLFALDEISIGDRKFPPTIRCDILAIGMKDGIYFPVLIELKYGRVLGRLTDQLKDFIGEITDDSEISSAFASLIKKATGLEDDICFDKNFRKIIVWPALESGKNARPETGETLKDNKIVAVEYQKNNSENVSDWIFQEKVYL